MLTDLLGIMNTVRENLFENFMLPTLDISYWDFCISLLIIGLIIRVLVNGAPNSHRSTNARSQKSSSSNKKNESE